jgi:hypothetical protein
MNFRNTLSRIFARAKSPIFFLALIAAAFLFPSLAQAQFRASLRGTITDPNGGAVVGATVTLTNTSTNEKLTSTTDASGIYQFNALAPAPYTLTVEKSGFQTKTLEHVVIVPEQPNGLDVQLQVGQVTESITVSGTTYALDTQNATISGTVSRNEIQSMPSFGRDVTKLAVLAPGVFGDEAQGGNGGSVNLPGTQTGGGASGGADGIFKTENGVQIIANGNQTEDNGVSIDGISTTSAVWGGSTVITPSESSIQSVRVVSNSYDAENGRFTGAQLQITTQSGTNQYHGSAFFVAHRPGLDAYQRFNGEGNPVTRDDNFYSQFGGGVGGPIWKNKIFGFFNYETVRSPKSQTSVFDEWAETSSFASSAPSGSIAAKYLTFPGSAILNKGIAPIGLGVNQANCTTAGLSEGVNCVTIAGQGLDIGSPLTSGLGTQDPGWTSATSPGVGGGLDGVPDITEYVATRTSNYSDVQYNGRLDADVTSNDHLAFAIYWVPESKNSLNGPPRQYDYFHHSQINDALSLVWNHTFSPTMLNEFRVNAAGWRWNEINSNSQSPVGLPTDYIDTIGNLGLADFGPSVGSILNQWTYSYKDVATKVIGRHTIKFGGDLTRLFYLQDCAGCGVPHYNFFNLWDFLNDAPHVEGSGFSPTTGFPTTIRQDQRENLWGFFVQDDFQLRRNLTINAGLRWSYFGPLYSKEGNMLAAFPGAGGNYLTGLVIKPGNAWNAQKDNFGPQVGFAWSPGMFHDKLVLRGGYGLNYNQEEIAISAGISNNPGLVTFPQFSFSTPTTTCGTPDCGIVYAVSSGVNNLYGYPANPNAISSFGPNGLPTNANVANGTGVGVVIIPRDLPTMRTHHYSFEGEYEIGHDTTATLGYQGSISHDIFFHENPNAAPAAEGLTLNPQISGGDYWGVSGWGNYNALLAEVKHNFAQHFTADAQFTWSKSMDTSSGPYFEQPYPYNLNLDYGRSDYNFGKALKLYGVWQPVIFHGDNGWMEKIAGGWSISGFFIIHGGFPWTPLVNITGGNQYCGTCGYTQLFPAAFTAKPGTSTSNDAFKTVANSNFPNGPFAYFAAPTYTPYPNPQDYGSGLPEAPGVRRNSLVGPGYKDVDMMLSKGFGLPRLPVLGENARLEFDVDAYNIFNNLNFNPGSISNTIGTASSTGAYTGTQNGIFGTATNALAARVVTLGARFEF